MKKYISKKYEIVARLQLRGKHFEFWLPIKDFPNYEVSTEGRIRNIKTRKLLKISEKNNKSQLILSNSGKTHMKSVAQIVLKTFTKTPYVKGNAIHLNGNPYDNTLSNIEYKNDERENPRIQFFPIPDFPSYLINKRGDILNKNTKNILRPTVKKNGYLQVILCEKTGHHHLLVHRLVALTFIKNPNNLPFVNHINGIKLDNRVKNLEWVSAQKNSEHASRTHLLEQGSRRYNAKLKEEYISWIERMYDVGISKRKIAEVYGVSEKTIHLILQNKTWKHC